MDDKAIFPRGWQRTFGGRNPTRMDVPFWLDQIRTGANAYAARRRLGFDGVEGRRLTPTWCFERFGQSRTRLPDGRVVCVGGEHEDYGDPDFCIYNDVTVFRPDGGVEIYGYPPDAFPPTDGHTATLVGDRLWLIGSIGYAYRRGESAPVFTLRLDNMKIEAVKTKGADPGWLANGRAVYLPELDAIRVGGATDFTGDPQPVPPAELDLCTLRWRRVAEDDLPWTQPPFEPTDMLTAVAAKDRFRVMDTARQNIPPGHDLFGVELWPLAHDWATGEDLLEVADDSERVARFEVGWGCGRIAAEKLRLTIFPNFAAAARAGKPAQLVPRFSRERSER